MRSRAGLLPVIAAVASLGASCCYLAILPTYLVTSIPAGVWWILAAFGQLTMAVLLVRRPSRRYLAAAAVVSAVVVLVWLVTRLSGPPELRYAMWRPVDTVVGFTDVLIVGLQAVAAGSFGAAAARWPKRGVQRPALAVAVAAVPLVAVALVSVAGVAFATDGFTAVTEPYGRTLAAGEVLRPGSATTLTYCSPDSVRLTMRVYEPPATARRPAPVVLYVHGGGLILGDRGLSGLGAMLANHDGALFPQLLNGLTARGMVVASIDYRLAPLAPWPAQLQDAKCAVRFLRAHVTALGVDPARIGVWGSSAGGQLAALLGTAPGFDAGPYSGESSRVQAVVDMFGPTDLVAMRHASPFGRTVVQIGLGGSNSVRSSASPATYVRPDDPPFLILHGSADPLVPPAQSTDLARRLAAAGAPVTLVQIRGAGHGLNTTGQRPTPSQITQMIVAFFIRTLK